MALDIIKDFEKWMPNPYNDSANYCTIGYGHLISKKECSKSEKEISTYKIPLSLDFGLSILESDTKHARLSVQQHVTTQLTDEQFGALTSFIFNIGSGAFSKSTMLKYLNNEEYDSAEIEFNRWIVAGGKVSNGLISRRACERALFRGDISYRADGKFHREDCEQLGVGNGTENPIDITIGEID